MYNNIIIITITIIIVIANIYKHLPYAGVREFSLIFIKLLSITQLLLFPFYRQRNRGLKGLGHVPISGRVHTQAQWSDSRATILIITRAGALELPLESSPAPVLNP